MMKMKMKINLTKEDQAVLLGVLSREYYLVKDSRLEGVVKYSRMINNIYIKLKHVREETSDESKSVHDE